MKVVKNTFIIILLTIFMIISINTICYGVAVTEEKLNEVFKNILEQVNDSDYSYAISNGVISISDKSKTYDINYNLESNPSFYVSLPVKQGMSYSEFEEQVSNGMILPLVGYIATANIQGIEVEDTLSYLMMKLLEGAFQQGIPTTNNNYIIMDGEIPDGENRDPKIIYKSEFGDRVMEYVNSLYSTEVNISDNSENDTFLWTITQSDKTDTSCVLTSTVKVNMDADFSKLKGYSESLGGNNNKDNNSDDNNNGNNNSNNNNKSNNSDKETKNDVITEKKNNSISNINSNKTNENKTSAVKTLPKAGTRGVFVLIIVLFIAILLGIKNKEYKDIK